MTAAEDAEDDRHVALVEAWLHACRAQLVADEDRTATAYRIAQYAWRACSERASAIGLQEDAGVYRGLARQNGARRILAMVGGRR